MMSGRFAPALPASTQSSDFALGATIDSPLHKSGPVDAPDVLNRKESSDGYGRVVAVLNPKWRVIECRDGIQWILQSRDSLKPEVVWRGRSYCRTKEALLRVCALHAGEINPTAAAVLAALHENRGCSAQQRLSSRRISATE
jgi:hypothetical protein